MSDYLTARRELDNCEMAELDAAHIYGPERYGFYRRKGYSKTEALSYAKAWGQNVQEQASRRKNHETGVQ